MIHSWCCLGLYQVWSSAHCSLVELERYHIEKQPVDRNCPSDQALQEDRRRVDVDQVRHSAVASAADQNKLNITHRSEYTSDTRPGVSLRAHGHI
jgi:hypothetical protein